ncbi:hypothetical protein [Paractinoplanes lichenicola]|uniref:AAA+ ATPase domain-containing protein n=1 Tax=Paractinoplanes lichenicola TaxID=2802976 RepID=A0ABS1W058_9ACTN|nr:hypothetical protein [Actinoplanes lichenicola]MBL7260126.1 hypothetical protein [Actinoplanes lichenicola]
MRFPVRRARAVAVLALAIVVLPLLVNFLSDDTPDWLTSPALIIPVTVCVFAALAYDQFRPFADTQAPTAAAESRFAQRLVNTTLKTLEARDRGSIDVEAGVVLGPAARLPLTLRPAGEADGPHRAVSSVAELVNAVVDLRGGLSVTLVGEPGSGKSTFLRDATWALAEDAAARLGRGEEPVMPVLIDAGSWPAGLDLAGHVRQTVRQSSAVPGAAVDRWLAAGTVYLLIDNLSWLPPLRRKKAIEQVNAFRTAHPAVGLLIGANADGTRAGGAELDLPALVVESVTAGQVHLHLDRFRGTHDELRTVARDSPDLVEVLRTRLFFTTALLAFPDRDGTTMLRLRDGDPRKAIIESYAESMLLRDDRAGPLAAPGARVEREAFLRDLGWIAAQLHRLNSFYLRDYLMVEWIPQRTARRVINLAVGLLVALVAALGAATILVPRHPVAGLGVALTLFVLLSAVHLPDRTGDTAIPVRTARPRVSWSVREFRRGFRRFGGLVTIGCALFDAYRLYQGLSVWGSLDAAQRQRLLIFAVVAVLSVSALALLQGVQWDWTDTENWAVGPVVRPFGPFALRSARWAAYAGLTSGVVTALTFATARMLLTAFSAADRPYGEVLASLRPAFDVGALAAAVVFVTVLVVLLSARLEVTVVEARLRDDGLIPADLAGFLHRATRLALLQRTGGNEYTFSHQILRDHFATRGPNPGDKFPQATL